MRRSSTPAVLTALAACVLAATGPQVRVTPTAAAPAPAAPPSQSAASVQEIRTYYTSEYGITEPAGLTWDPQQKDFVLLEKKANIATLRVKLDDRAMGGTELDGVVDGATVAVSPDGQPTAIVGDTLLTFSPGGTQRTPVPEMRLTAPAGAAYGRDAGINVLDGQTVVRRDPQGNVTSTPVTGAAGHALRGLSARAGSDLLYTYDADADELLGVDPQGAVAERYDLSPLTLEVVRGLVVAPSTDATDDPATQSLYIADARKGRFLGEVVEASLGDAKPVAADVTALAAVSATLVRTTDTSRFSPSSPDPSGIAYQSGSDRLVISDGEVDEMPIFQNANLFVTTRAGALQTTGVTLPWSNEPVGSGYNPTNNHLIVSDDDKEDVFDVAPNNDTRFGTADDTISTFDTLAVGNDDPEGVDYDAPSNSVWTTDGTNREVYRFRPGSDARFGTADDVRTHFDIGTYGALDPEGIGYDSVRDTLVVVDDNSHTIYELAKDGTLLNTIDINPIGARKAAGIAVAPGSQNSSQRNYYVVDRGVDNNSDPSENDGKMYEISAPLPPIGGTTNQPPAVNAGPDQTITMPATPPATAQLDGTVTDTTIPSGGTLTSTWSTVSGPGTVTFGNANAVDTTASFPVTGTYVLRLTATDGALTSSDELTVTVQSPGAGGATTVEKRIAAGADDVEQRVSGGMDLTSSDLELTTDGTTQQVVGLRFTALAIPAGATITNAYVQFRTDEVSTGTSSLTIRAETTDNAPAYTSTSGNVTSRATTTTSVPWTPPDWPTVGAVTEAQRTPNLNALVQAVVSRTGWAQGNALALQISGTGRRTAEAFESGAALAPLLHVEYTGSGGGATNQPPVVDAGPDQTITMPATPPATAQLDGTVTDTTIPSGSTLTSTWSRVSGPGTVTFGNANAVDTTALFPVTGTYVLRLSASDGALSNFDELTVIVQSPGAGGATTVEKRIAASSDDAEQRLSGGMDLTSSDLELTTDGTTQQVVGLRFNALAIPAGATITNAYVQFQVDEVSTGASSLTLRAEATDNAPTYTTTSGNITGRTTTTANVAWSPPDWPTANVATAAQRTPNLAALVQAVVGRPGWAQGNALALQISGTGRRTAEAFNGVATAAPLLHVEYTTG